MIIIILLIIGNNNPKFDTIFNFQSPYRLVNDDDGDDDKNSRKIHTLSKQTYISTAPPMHVWSMIISIVLKLPSL